MKTLILLPLAILLISSSLLQAETIEIGQKNKSFSEKKLHIKKGDQIKFTNQDPFFHNVYSMSETTSFDLGSYPKGKYKSVTFNKTGKVKVQCAIHPSMKMTIVVE